MNRWSSSNSAGKMSDEVQPQAPDSAAIGPQYLIDSAGNRIAVVIPIAVYEQLIERLEDYEDAAWAQQYADRKAAELLMPDELDGLPLDQAFAEIEAERAALERKVG